MSKKYKERWNELLINMRFRESQDAPNNDTTDHRNPFEKDYSRLLFSPPFRRMQDKTQVFPLNESDFVRTRLTHSLEVSTIARGIGMSVEGELIKKHFLENEKQGHIVSLLSTACLVHDIGNPPFGHFGEAIVQNYFKKYLKDITPDSGFKDKYQQKWEKVEIEDLINFDGNVQTFRILKKLQFYKDEHSYNLTLPTLACIIKYPYSSLDGNKKEHKNVTQHKFGFFNSEKKDFEFIWSKLKLGSNSRHPITYLVEAADDITYLACDVEDGCKRGIITMETLEKYIEQYLKTSNCTELDKKLVADFEASKNEQQKNFKGHFDVIIQMFRVNSQGYMIDAVIKNFIKNHEQIIGGSYCKNLLDESDAKNIKELLRELAKLIHKNKEIIQMEILGERVITGLLETFVKAINSSNRTKTKELEGKIYELTSSSYRHIFETYKYVGNESYANCQFAIDSIAGMTDNYALSLYQKILGIKI